MDSKVLLVVFGLCAVIAVTEGIKCYKCQRLEFLNFKWGKNEDNDVDERTCEYPVVEGAPESTETDCAACFTDTREENFDWVERGCIPAGETCTPGKAKHDTALPNTDWIGELPLFDSGVKFESKRECCSDADLCNKMWFNPDGATTAQLSVSLFVAIAAAIFYNLRQ